MVTVDLRFDKHMSNICLKPNRKLSALTRVAKFVRFKKRPILFKIFIELQFKAISNLPGGYLSEFFVKNNRN